jgi:hypothetical protein
MFTSHPYPTPLAKLYTHPISDDPCPVFDGKRWHCFGQGEGEDGRWGIYHSSSLSEYGPWVGHAVIYLLGVANSTQPPGVIYEDGAFHLFVNALSKDGDGFAYFISLDGEQWYSVDTTSSVKSGHVSVYNPKPVAVDDVKYLIYSDGKSSDRFIAKSKTDTWNGPWLRMGVLPDITTMH